MLAARIPRMEEEQQEPEFLTVKQVAKQLNLSVGTVQRIFSKVPGVIDIGRPSLTRRRGARPYQILRIPRGVLSRFLMEHRIR